MTSNPFKGVLTGLGITTVSQSSYATTVIVLKLITNFPIFVEAA